MVLLKNLRAFQIGSIKLEIEFSQLKVVESEACVHLDTVYVSTAYIAYLTLHPRELAIYEKYTPSLSIVYL